MSVLLTWDAYPGADSYNVYRTNDLSIAYTLLGSSTSPSYTDTTALSTVQYYYYTIPFSGTTPLAGSNPVLIGANENRVGKICTKILKKTKQMGQSEINADDLIAEMENVQLELCRDYLALKAEFALVLVKDQIGYPLNPSIFKIRQIITPVGWRCPEGNGKDVISKSTILSPELKSSQLFSDHFS